MLDEKSLIAQIEAAFETAVAPAEGAISRPSNDDEGTSEYFSGRTWRGHGTARLRRLDFALNIFTDAAFAYFMPAFMIAAVRDPEAADTIPEQLLFWLDPEQ